MCCEGESLEKLFVLKAGLYRGCPLPTPPPFHTPGESESHKYDESRVLFF